MHGRAFFSDGMALEMFLYGVVMSASTLGIYFVSATVYGGVVATTMAFLTLGLTQLFHVFNVRSSIHSVFGRGRQNKWMYYAFVLSAALQVVVVLVRPLNVFFNVVPLTGFQWLYVFLASFVVIPICEVIKLLRRLYKNLRRKLIEQGK